MCEKQGQRQALLHAFIQDVGSSHYLQLNLNCIEKNEERDRFECIISDEKSHVADSGGSKAAGEEGEENATWSSSSQQPQELSGGGFPSGRVCSVFTVSRNKIVTFNAVSLIFRSTNMSNFSISWINLNSKLKESF